MEKKKKKKIAYPNPTHDSIHRLGDSKPIKKKKKKNLILIPNSKLNPATFGFVSISQVSSPFQIQKIRRCQVGQVQGQSQGRRRVWDRFLWNNFGGNPFHSLAGHFLLNI